MQPMYPPHAQRPRSPFLVPLVTLCALLAVLLVAIGVVAIVKLGGDATPSGARSSVTPRASAVASGIDACVVGNWRVTSNEERVDIEGFGTVTFTGSGARVRLARDGTGVTDYGSGTQFEGTANGSTVRMTLRGIVTFRYRTAGEIVSFDHVTADGTAVVSLNGTEIYRLPLGASDEPARYTCSAGEKLTESTAFYLVEMVPDG